MIPYVSIDREFFVYPDIARRAVRDAEHDDEQYHDHAIARVVTGATVVTMRAGAIHPSSLDHLFASAMPSDAALRMIGSRKRTALDGFDPSYDDDE